MRWRIARDENSMTVTSSHPRTTGHPAAALRRFGVALTLAILLAILSGLGVVAPASAATDDDADAPEPSAPATVTFTLAPLSGGVLSPGSALAATAVISNETVVDLPRESVTLELSTTPVSNQARLQSWLDGETAGIATSVVVTDEVDAVPAGTEETLTLRLPASDSALSELDAGVYPVLGRYGDRVSTSAVVVPGDDTADVAVILPVTAAPAAEGLLTRDELAVLTAADGGLTALLDAAEGTETALAVDPAIAAAIRVLGSAAPQSATAWLQRLMTIPNPRFALQFGDADVTVQIAAGRESPLKPTSLAAYIDPEDVVEPTAGPNATPTLEPTPDADVAPVPTTAELLDIGATGPTIYAPDPDGVTDEIAAVLAASDDTALTLASSTRTASGADGSSVPARGRTASGDAVLVADAGISQAVSAATREDAVVVRAAPVAATTALTALAVAEAQGDPLLVMVGRGADRSPQALTAGLSAVLDAPGVDAVELDDVIRADPSPVELTAPGPADDRVEAFEELRGDEDRVDAFASILVDPTMLTGPQRASVLQLLAVSWAAAPDAWSVALDEARTATETTLDSVGILPPSSIQLLSSETPLPFWIRNDLPFDVDVVLFATPDDLRLDVQRMTPVAAGPSSNTRVQVPVQARVGNGELMLDLQLRSPTGVAIGERQTADVNVRAEWETVGIVVLAILVGGLLAVGVFRTVRRRAVARRDTPPTADGDAGTGSAA